MLQAESNIAMSVDSRVNYAGGVKLPAPADLHGQKLAAALVNA
jgi:hypothetical protein